MFGMFENQPTYKEFSMKSWIMIISFICFAAFAAQPTFNISTSGQEVTRMTASKDLAFAGYFQVQVPDENSSVTFSKLEVVLPRSLASIWEEAQFDIIEYGDEESTLTSVRMENRTGHDRKVAVSDAGFTSSYSYPVTVYVSISFKDSVDIQTLRRLHQQIKLTKLEGYDEGTDRKVRLRKRVNLTGRIQIVNSELQIYDSWNWSRPSEPKTGRAILGFDVAGWRQTQLKKLTVHVTSNGVKFSNLILCNDIGQIFSLHPAQLDKDGNAEIYIGTKEDDQTINLWNQWTTLYVYAQVDGWGDYGDTLQVSVVDDQAKRPQVGAYGRVDRKSAITWCSVTDDHGLSNAAQNGFGVYVSPWCSETYTTVGVSTTEVRRSENRPTYLDELPEVVLPGLD